MNYSLPLVERIKERNDGNRQAAQNAGISKPDAGTLAHSQESRQKLNALISARTGQMSQSQNQSKAQTMVLTR